MLKEIHMHICMYSYTHTYINKGRKIACRPTSFLHQQDSIKPSILCKAQSDYQTEF